MHAYRTHTCADLRAANVGEEVRLSGWIHRKREHGECALRRSARPLWHHPDRGRDRVADLYPVLNALRPRVGVTFTGKVAARSPETLNPNLATGEIEIYPTEG
jgi:aspartyl-tRNA synthetase